MLPVSILTRGCSGTRLGYKELSDEEDDGFLERQMVTVVVGKEKREFLVDPIVLEETPFRALIRSDSRRMTKKTKKMKKVVFLNVDAILFEHMLWLMHNDCSSLFELNLEEIIDFYAQDS